MKKSTTHSTRITFGAGERNKFLLFQQQFCSCGVDRQYVLEISQPWYECWTFRTRTTWKKSHPTKSRSHPRISKSPWHNAVNKLDQTCSYGSEILSCLCVLSNIWSKTVVFFDQPAVGTTDWTIKHLGVPELSFGAKFQWVGYTSLGHLEATWIFLLNPMDCI